MQPQWLEYEVYCLGVSRFSTCGARVLRTCVHFLLTWWLIREACGPTGGNLMNSRVVILPLSMPLWSPLDGIGLSWWPFVMPLKCPTKRSLRRSRALVLHIVCRTCYKWQHKCWSIYSRCSSWFCCVFLLCGKLWSWFCLRGRIICSMFWCSRRIPSSLVLLYEVGLVWVSSWVVLVATVYYLFVLVVCCLMMDEQIPVCWLASWCCSCCRSSVVSGGNI